MCCFWQTRRIVLVGGSPAGTDTVRTALGDMRIFVSLQIENAREPAVCTLLTYQEKSGGKFADALRVTQAMVSRLVQAGWRVLFSGVTLDVPLEDFREPVCWLQYVGAGCVRPCAPSAPVLDEEPPPSYEEALQMLHITEAPPDSRDSSLRKDLPSGCK